MDGLGKKIEEMKLIRDEKAKVLEQTLNQLEIVRNQIHCAKQHNEWASEVESAREHLELKNKLIELTLEKAKLQQQVEECPPVLMDEINLTCKELKEKITELEEKLKLLIELEASYDALGPRFKELHRKWTEIENKIAVKEWSLKELENMQNCSALDDSFLSESFS